jgi:hypothetical protein
VLEEGEGDDLENDEDNSVEDGLETVDGALSSPLSSSSGVGYKTL